MTQEEKDREEMEYIEKTAERDHDIELADTLTAISIVAQNLAKRLRNEAERLGAEAWKHHCNSIQDKLDEIRNSKK